MYDAARTLFDDLVWLKECDGVAHDFGYVSFIIRRLCHILPGSLRVGVAYVVIFVRFVLNHVVMITFHLFV